MQAAGRRVLDRRQGGGDFTEHRPDRGTGREGVKAEIHWQPLV